MKRKPLFLRLTPADHDKLFIAAKAYRAPSVNWFVNEMIGCMLNPSRWSEFATRLLAGEEQQHLALTDPPKGRRHTPKTGHAPRPAPKRRKGGRHA